MIRRNDTPRTSSRPVGLHRAAVRDRLVELGASYASYLGWTITRQCRGFVAIKMVRGEEVNIYRDSLDEIFDEADREDRR